MFHGFLDDEQHVIQLWSAVLWGASVLYIYTRDDIFSLVVEDIKTVVKTSSYCRRSFLFVPDNKLQPLTSADHRYWTKDYRNQQICRIEANLKTNMVIWHNIQGSFNLIETSQGLKFWKIQQYHWIWNIQVMSKLLFSCMQTGALFQVTVCVMDGGRIFYVGAKWGQSRGLGGQRKIDTVEHQKSKETEVLMIKESTGNESLVYLFINTNLS